MLCLVGQLAPFEEYCLVGCEAVQFGKYVPNVQNNALNKSLGYERKGTSPFLYVVNYVSPKRNYLSTKLHSVTCQNTTGPILKRTVKLF